MSAQLVKQEPEYKETELGMLPIDWNVRKIKDLAEVKYGKSNPRDLGNIPVIGSSGVFSHTSKPLVNFPTIVIGRKGNAGKAWLFMKPCFPSDTTFYLEWKEKVDVKYLFEYLTFNPLSGEHAKTTVPSLTRPDLENQKVPLPPLPEQKSIAYVLSTIKSSLEKTGNVINSLLGLKKSLMKHLFTYGAVRFEDANKVKLKESEIGMIPEGWKVKELKEIATLQRGKDLPKQEWKKGTVPIIGSSGIMGYHEEAVCEGPGVVTGRSGSIGKVTYIEGDYWPHNTALYVKDFHENDTRFVYYLMQTLDFEKYATGVSVPTLNRNFIHMAKKAVPPLPAQQEIASFLSIIDSNIGYEENKKKALGQLFKSTLYNLMSAKIRLKDSNLVA